MAGSMTETSERLVTLAEFERMPEENEHLVELVRGRVVREPRPGGEHGWLAGRLIGRLEPWAEKHEVGLVVTETGFLLTDDPPTVRGPDVAFIAEERLGSGIPKGFWTIPPDLAIEIVSPSDTAAEIQEKVLEYLTAGTRLVWVVDPDNRSVTAYRSRDDIHLLTEADELDGADVLPGFRLAVSELFSR